MSLPNLSLEQCREDNKIIIEAEKYPSNDVSKACEVISFYNQICALVLHNKRNNNEFKKSRLKKKYSWSNKEEHFKEKAERIELEKAIIANSSYRTYAKLRGVI